MCSRARRPSRPASRFHSGSLWQAGMRYQVAS
uniref:Gametogenetin binding protein 1 n=1 Tax=Mus musculus TaxID=10090 RepID=A0A494B9Y7_MOUSE